MASMLRAGRVLTAPGEAPVLRDQWLSFESGLIRGMCAAQGPDDGRIVVPALVNAHDHGRGLRHFAYGAVNAPLEAWRPALYAHPPIDPYLNAVVALGRMAEAGFGAALHMHAGIDIDRLPDEAIAYAQAARDIGIRLAFGVPLRDQRTLTLGPDAELLARHEAPDRAQLEATFLRAFPSPATYVGLVRDIAGRIEDDLVSVQYAPNNPQACSDALLQATAEASAGDGRRIHTHLLETKPQRAWADAQYPRGQFIPHLDRLGLLSPRFTGAHGVWLSEADCALLAERGAAIAVNTVSNLRLRSGIAPVDRFLRHGLDFAFGIDSAALDDDDDGWRDLRLSHHLHSLPDHNPSLTAALAFRAAGIDGQRLIHNRDGRLIEVGAPADFVVLDYARMSEDMIEGLVGEAEVVLTRATKAHVREVWVGGRRIVTDGRVTGVDLPAAERELGLQARAGREKMLAMQPMLKRHQGVIADWIGAGEHKRPGR